MVDSVNTKRKLQIGMIGGGQGAFIGEIHRLAIALCGDYALVAGAFSSNADVSRSCGEQLQLSADRVYSNYQNMLTQEAARPKSDRLDLIVIVTPNYLHYQIACLALENGFHVMCEKPLTTTVEEARSLQALVTDKAKRFTLTHTYLGYPLVSQARKMVARGEFGRIRKVMVEYHQGWLSRNEEAAGNQQACWRTDPTRSGISGCIGDIGTHAHNLAEYVVGQQVVEVCADLSTFVPGRKLDDDGAALFRMSKGAKGVLSASQVCAGIENGLKISVFGEEGSCEWRQEDPNSLVVRKLGRPASIYRSGSDQEYLYPEVQASFRTPSGHPEGFLEALANLYRTLAVQIWQDFGISPEQQLVPVCPDIEMGVRGMVFIEAMVTSSNEGGSWVPLG